MDGVPYPQPLAGPVPQYVPWGVLLVRPIGHPPRPVPPRAADQRSRAYPTLLRVLRWGRYGHRGGPQTPEVGSLAGAPRGPFSSRPPFRCAVCGGWCPVSPGWGGGGGGGGVRCSWLCCLRACRPLLWSCGGGAWCVVCGCVVCGGGVLAGLWVVCGVVGPSPLLAEVPVCYSPPLLAGFRCRWWWAVPATPGWGPLAAVVCGVWRWCVGCWSLATPGGGSCVLLPATPGWVSLPVVVGGPRHSWLGSAGGGGVWRVAVVCWLLVPRHSWRRFLCATPRHSWLGFAAGGGAWCAVCGVRRVACGGGVCGGFVAGVVGPSPLLAEVPVCYSPPLLAGFRCRWWWAVPATPGWGPLAAVVCGVWRWCVGCWSLATPGGGSCVLLPATPGWVSLPVVVGGPRHSWLGSAGGGGVWCVAVVCWLLVPRHSWRRFLCATPRHSWLGFAAGGGAWCAVCGVRRVACGGGVCGGFVAGVVGRSPLLAEVPVCYSPPLLAGFRCRWGPLAAVVCGVWRCAPPLLAGSAGGGGVWLWRWCVGCWSLATPGGGSCVLLPATPGWVSLPVVVGGPRHSWLGSAGGGGVWCVAVVCWLLVPRHSWRRFLCATPRHSWLGFAAGGGAWCAVCGVRRVACGVRRWRVWWVCGWCGWSLATPGGGSCVLLPATPGWVSLPVVVGGPRHSWLGSAGGGGVWCVAVVCWLLFPRHSWRRFLCATPRHSWLGFAAGGGGRSPPLLAGVRWRRWCVVCGGVCWLLVPRHSWRRFLCATPRHSWLGFAAGGGAWCAVCGVRRVVCGGGVCGGFVAGVVGPSPLLAEVPVCYSPPLLAGFRCRWWWAVPATPGWGPLAAVVCGVWRWCVGCWSLATPGWVSLSAVVRGVRCVVCGVRRAAVACVVGLWLVWLVPRLSWRRFLCATPRHSWLGFAAGGGVVWCCGGCVFRVPFPLALVCVCALCGPSCWCGWPGGGGGGGSRSVWLSCVRVRVLAVCGWWGGVCHTLAGSRRRSSACFKRQKKRSCRCVAEMRGMCDAWYVPVLSSHHVFFPC